MELLETKTTRIEVNGVHCYVTPLLRIQMMPKLRVPREVVMKNLPNTDRKLVQDPQHAATYQEEIKKLELAGYATKIHSHEADTSKELWFLPHHMVRHNGKDRIVFNCSFQIVIQTLSTNILPGLTLGPSLLGVLQRFGEYQVTISGDIKGIFHQVHLLKRQALVEIPLERLEDR